MRWRRKKPKMEDSGLMYCVTHHGVREVDGLVCDFARDELHLTGLSRCEMYPLLYDPNGKGEIVEVD